MRKDKSLRTRLMLVANNFGQLISAIIYETLATFTSAEAVTLDNYTPEKGTFVAHTGSDLSNITVGAGTGTITGSVFTRYLTYLNTEKQYARIVETETSKPLYLIIRGNISTASYTLVDIDSLDRYQVRETIEGIPYVRQSVTATGVATAHTIEASVNGTSLDVTINGSAKPTVTISATGDGSGTLFYAGGQMEATYAAVTEFEASQL